MPPISAFTSHVTLLTYSQITPASEAALVRDEEHTHSADPPASGAALVRDEEPAQLVDSAMDPG
jgi:hypothetical protein